MLAEVFGEPKLKTYRYRDIHSFRVGITVDGARVGDEGDISISLLVADDKGELPQKLHQARDESRHDRHKNDVYWTFAFTPEIDDLVANLHTSRQMVARYEQLRAQSRITNEEMSALSSEKQEALRVLGRLRDKVEAVVMEGAGMFGGVARDGSSLGKTVVEAFGKYLEAVIPDLYSKLSMGARQLKGQRLRRCSRRPTSRGCQMCCTAARRASIWSFRMAQSGCPTRRLMWPRRCSISEARALLRQQGHRQAPRSAFRGNWLRLGP